MNNTLITALGLMLVLEGLLPLFLPQAWRETFKRMIELRGWAVTFLLVWFLLLVV